MTDLLSRPRARTPGEQPPSDSAAVTSHRRPLSVSGLLAGAGTATAGLAVFLGIAVAGWFLADGGAPVTGLGDTRDAMRVGADAWLLALGSHLSFGGVDYTVVPLGLTALLTWAAYRGGAWAGRTSEPPEPATLRRELAVAAGLFTAGFVVVAVVAGVVAATAEVRGNLVLTVVGALLVSGVGGGCGILTATDGWSTLREALPAQAWPAVHAALAALAALLTCAAALVVVALVANLGASASLVSRLHLGGSDAVMLVLLTAAVAPNAVLLGASYLLGPGFAVGAGTSVSTGGVVLGPVPAFPLLSGLPAAGHPAWWTAALLSLPSLSAAVGVALVQRRHPVYAWDLAAVRGVGAGVLAGVAAGLLCALGGGSLGDGRMAVVGVSLPAVVAAGAVSMGLGGLVGGLLTAAVQRRGLVQGETAGVDEGEEQTVEVALPRRAPEPASPREREARDLLQRLVRQPDTSGDDEDTIRFL